MVQTPRRPLRNGLQGLQQARDHLLRLHAGAPENHPGTRDHGSQHPRTQQSQSQEHGQLPAPRIQPRPHGVRHDRAGRNPRLHGSGTPRSRLRLPGRQEAQTPSGHGSDVLRPLDQHRHLRHHHPDEGELQPDLDSRPRPRSDDARRPGSSLPRSLQGI